MKRQKAPKRKPFTVVADGQPKVVRFGKAAAKETAAWYASFGDKTKVKRGDRM